MENLKFQRRYTSTNGVQTNGIQTGDGSLLAHDFELAGEEGHLINLENDDLIASINSVLIEAAYFIL